MIELDGHKQQTYLPARNLDAIRVGDIIHSVKGDQSLSSESGADKAILELLTSGEKKLEALSDNKNLREILDELNRLEENKSNQQPSIPQRGGC